MKESCIDQFLSSVLALVWRVFDLLWTEDPPDKKNRSAFTRPWYQMWFLSFKHRRRDGAILIDALQRCQNVWKQSNEDKLLEERNTINFLWREKGQGLFYSKAQCARNWMLLHVEEGKRNHSSQRRRSSLIYWIRHLHQPIC